ncbi:MAG: hypothetical protein IJW59_04875 [Clostridia bacterium]|nr:hypothetical protein [Clostridia bacterium]
MPIYKDEPGNNGDDSVLITDLRKCRSMEDIDKQLNKITQPSVFQRLKSFLCKKKNINIINNNDNTLEK